MTLSQTYISRKQLLVDNLVAKGVTGYTVNDGLTTLINAVLEIQGGGGVRTLTLTSDKDILSYADSESATLTATLLEDGVGVSGATVEFFNGSTSLGTAQTDSTGVATKTYNSTGAGDISLTASDGTLVSETYSIEDCTAYITDFSSWDTVSNKGTAYKFSPFTAPTNNSIEIKFNSANATRIAIGDTTHMNSSGYLEWIYAWYIDGCDIYYRSSTNSELNTNNFHSAIKSGDVCRIELNGNTLDTYINDTFIRSFTTYDTLSLTRLIRLNSNTVSNIDNMKVKPL